MFKTWDQLTRVEQLCCEYSDFHKEVYGFRSYLDPNISVEAAEAAMEDLAKYAKIVFAQEAEDEKQAVREFEELVEKTIAAGAKTRETALKWIMDASEADGDWEYLCFLKGIPYGYFRKAA